MYVSLIRKVKIKGNGKGGHLRHLQIIFAGIIRSDFIKKLVTLKSVT